MKFGKTRNLLVSIALIMILLISHISEAQDSVTKSKGIPSATWSSSKSEISSISTRNGPGLPGQWSPSYNPSTDNHVYREGNPNEADIINKAPVRVQGEDVMKKGYSGHGIPSSTWSTSTDEISSASTRTAPGPIGDWSPYATPSNYADSLATHNDKQRDLQAAETTRRISSASGTRSAPHEVRTISSSNTGAKAASTSTSGTRTATISTTGPKTVSKKPSTTKTSTTSSNTKTGSTASASGKTVSSKPTIVSSNTRSTHANVSSRKFSPTVKSSNSTSSVTKPISLKRAAPARVSEEPITRPTIVEKNTVRAPIRPIPITRPVPVVEEIIVPKPVIEEFIIEKPAPTFEVEKHLPTTESMKTINEYNKAQFPGLIFGVDEEIEIER